MWKIVIFCGFFGFVWSQTSDVTRCLRSDGELPINVYISGCPSPQPFCTLIQGETAIVDIIFKAPRTMRHMTTRAEAFLVNSWLIPGITYDLGENSVTCNFLLNSYCPVIENEVLQYQLKMPILESFPASDQNIFIEFRIEDDNQTPVMCLRTTIRIGRKPDNRGLFNNNETLAIYN